VHLQRGTRPPKMAQSLLWADLSPAQLAQLGSCDGESSYKTSVIALCNIPTNLFLAATTNRLGPRRLLSAIMGLKDDDRSQVLLEMYINNLKFAKAQGFSPECTSTYFSIMKSTFDISMSKSSLSHKSLEMVCTVRARSVAWACSSRD
jgi:hypothetical protein